VSRHRARRLHPGIAAAGVFCVLAALLILTIGKKPQPGSAAPAAA
jgi:hypothetical protein